MAEDKDSLDLSGLLPLILGALDNDNTSETGKNPEVSSAKNDGGGGGFDPSILPGLMAAVNAFTTDDEQVRLLRALKPMLSPKRQERMDGAVRICKLASALPALKESGLLDKLL